jgi:hypothetical protein
MQESVKRVGILLNNVTDLHRTENIGDFIERVKQEQPCTSCHATVELFLKKRFDVPAVRDV